MHTRWTLGPIPFALAGIVAVCNLGGCTTRTQVFEGYNDDQLWTAMVATARSPDYDDWKVSENEVYIDDASRRIEIYRRLKRTFVSPYAEPRREDAEWKFQIVLARDEELDEPTVDFTARQIKVPAHVWREADRYFMQMRTLLGPMQPKQAPAPAAEPEVAPMPEADATPSAEPTAQPATEPPVESLPE
jgi:hypothetical protein